VDLLTKGLGGRDRWQIGAKNGGTLGIWAERERSPGFWVKHFKQFEQEHWQTLQFATLRRNSCGTFVCFLSLNLSTAGNRAPTLLLPLPSPVQVDPVIPAVLDSPKGKKKQLDLPPVYNPINPVAPVAPLSVPVNGAPIIQVKTAHRLEPKRTVKNGFKVNYLFVLNIINKI
jgi:hypothetical protein